jgi:hypothetical protein
MSLVRRDQQPRDVHAHNELAPKVVVGGCQDFWASSRAVSVRGVETGCRGY